MSAIAENPNWKPIDLKQFIRVVLAADASPTDVALLVYGAYCRTMDQVSAVFGQRVG